MRAHIIEIGPNAIRRLCCGAATIADSETEQAAFESVDDTVALVDLRPVTVASLWQNVLAAIDCGTAERVCLVHPSWWSTARVAVVTAAAEVLAGDADVRPRSWLLTRAAPSKFESATIVVEIAADFVVISGAAMAAETRRRGQSDVAEAVAHSILTMASDATETVVIDAPAKVDGAQALASIISEHVRSSCGMTVVRVDDIQLRKLAGELKPDDRQCGERGDAAARFVGRRLPLPLLLLVVGVLISFGAMHRHAAPRASGDFTTTFAVEGAVALEVPAQWPMRRVIAGPGSARLQITSPSDPEVALHVTQSRVALPGLDATAEFLKSAIDASSAGVFVDFNPAARSAGRPVVTYREIRAGHQILWTVWVDKAVRISIGCQSRSSRDDPVGQECELAIRSARALD